MTIEITEKMIEAGINATGSNYEGRPLWKCAIDVQVTEIYRAMEAARTGHIKESDILLPNDSGQTSCIVQWIVETPSGWVGAWDINSIKHLAGIEV